jgi:hypothetical protein
LLEGSLNFARAPFNLQKAIKLEEIKEKKIERSKKDMGT